MEVEAGSGAGAGCVSGWVRPEGWGERKGDYRPWPRASVNCTSPFSSDQKSSISPSLRWHPVYSLIHLSCPQSAGWIEALPRWCMVFLIKTKRKICDSTSLLFFLCLFFSNHHEPVFFSLTRETSFSGRIAAVGHLQRERERQSSLASRMLCLFICGV